MVSDKEIETAVGGSYELPDGRKFWIDRQAALEIVRRVRAVLDTARQSAPETPLCHETDR